LCLCGALGQDLSHSSFPSWFRVEIFFAPVRSVSVARLTLHVIGDVDVPRALLFACQTAEMTEAEYSAKYVAVSHPDLKTDVVDSMATPLVVPATMVRDRDVIARGLSKLPGVTM
jgi:hypothetical protein